DVEGVLDKHGSLIKSLTTAEEQSLIEDGTISGGMIPKIESCRDVIAEGVEAVVIINGKVPHAVLLELFTEHGAGTLIEPRRRKSSTRGDGLTESKNFATASVISRRGCSISTTRFTQPIAISSPRSIGAWASSSQTASASRSKRRRACARPTITSTARHSPD